MESKYINLNGLEHFRDKAIVTEIIDSSVGYILAKGVAKESVDYYERTGSGTTADPYVYTKVTSVIPGTTRVDTYYVVDTAGTKTSRFSASSVAGTVDFVNKEISKISKTMTQAHYDALTEAEKMNGTIYFITD